MPRLTWHAQHSSFNSDAAFTKPLSSLQHPFTAAPADPAAASAPSAAPSAFFHFLPYTSEKRSDAQLLLDVLAESCTSGCRMDRSVAFCGTHSMQRRAAVGADSTSVVELVRAHKDLFDVAVIPDKL